MCIELRSATKKLRLANSAESDGGPDAVQIVDVVPGVVEGPTVGGGMNASKPLGD